MEPRSGTQRSPCVRRRACAQAASALGKHSLCTPWSGRSETCCLSVCLSERGWDWYVCEGFQHILCQQAEALKALGVGPEVKVSPWPGRCSPSGCAKNRGLE